MLSSSLARRCTAATVLLFATTALAIHPQVFRVIGPAGIILLGPVALRLVSWVATSRPRRAVPGDQSVQ